MTTPESTPTSSNTIAPIGDTFQVQSLSATQTRQPARKTGQRTRAMNTLTGHTIRYTKPQQPLTRFSDVALYPSLLTAVRRCTTHKQPLTIQPHDLRQKVRTNRIPNLILFLVDASGSMAARQRMTAVKGAILSLLLDAYQKRDHVGLISFRGSDAELVLPPTNSVSLAQPHLEILPTGGKTPLAAGLQLAYQLLHRAMKKEQTWLPLIVLLSDGRANVGQNNPHQEAMQTAQSIAQRDWSSLVIDCERGYPRLGLAVKLGQALNGETIRLEQLSAKQLRRAVHQKLRH